MTQRNLDNLRGNQENRLLRIPDELSTGTRPLMITVEAFQDDLGLKTRRAAIVLRAFNPNWSVCSWIQDQIADILSRAHGPIVIIFPLRARRGRTGEDCFVAVVRTIRRGLRERSVLVLSPIEGNRALATSMLASTVTNYFKNVFIVEVQPRKNFFGMGCLTSGDTPTEFTSQGYNSQGPRSFGRLMIQGSSPQEFCQELGDNSRGLKPQGLELRGDNSQELCQAATGGDYPREIKPQASNPQGFSQAVGVLKPVLDLQGINSQEFRQELGGDYPREPNPQEFSQARHDEEPTEFSSMGFIQAGGDEIPPRGLNTLGFSRDNDLAVDGKVRNASNMKSVDTDDSRPLCNNTKATWLRAITLMLQYLQVISAPMGDLQRKYKLVVDCVDNGVVQIDGVKKVLSEKGPINAKDIQSGETDAANEVTGNLKGLRNDGILGDEAPCRISLANSHSCTDGIAVQDVHVKEDLVATRCINMEEILSGPIPLENDGGLRDGSLRPNQLANSHGGTDGIGVQDVHVKEDLAATSCSNVQEKSAAPCKIACTFADQTDVSVLRGPQNDQWNRKATQGHNKPIEISNYEDSDEEGGDESEAVADQLDIEDEDQLDMVLQDAQIGPGNGNNGIVENHIPNVQELPGLAQGFHLPPPDEAPVGVQILPHWLLVMQAQQAHAQAEAAQAQQEHPGPNEEAPGAPMPDLFPWMAVNAQPAQVNQGNLPLNPQEDQENIPPNPQGNQENLPQEDHGNLLLDPLGVQADEAVVAQGDPDQPDAPQGNENDEQVNQAGAPANGAGVPPPPPPPQANGPRNRLIAAARYLKRKLTRSHHGNHHHGLYTPGAPREERNPLGMEEAPAFQGGYAIPHNDEDGMEEERRSRWFASCFGFLYRRWRGAPVQEYPCRATKQLHLRKQLGLKLRK